MATIMEAVGRDGLMDQVIARLDDGFAAIGRGERRSSPPRGGFERAEPAPGVLEWMPHREAGDTVTIKTVSYSPLNSERYGLPTILGTVARFDDATGRLTSLMDGALPTSIRTGAASAIASRLLAPADARTIGIVGAGCQAVTQVHALTRVLPVERVLVWDVDPAHAASFAARVAFLGREVRVAEPELIMAKADVVCTATSVKAHADPVLPDTACRPDLHVNAVGADVVGKTELPESLVRRAFVTTDHPDQALREGESQRLSADRLGPTLADLCASPGRAVQPRRGLTVFDSTGVALEDHLVAEVFLEAATMLGLGTRLPIEHDLVNALDPYALSPTAARA
ncbi:alanine dehydrogenase [Nocardiopsis terrae]|uniref:Alanine dehydrogenase n=1 Tax=Nocardiopsis terrae TaxID=372655 RepID=A0ABR9HD31_9ACTN|nr:ornithine cyclodeaminase family protein [Nocardiopsis terrae]MBE1456936.1 alanine dehydrogenase [Nocardiopsis terrae]